MEAKKVQQQYLLSKWAAIIQECRATGMSVKDWCLENNVNTAQFFYWQCKIRKQLCTSVENLANDPSITFVPVQLPNSHNEPLQKVSFNTELIVNVGGYQLQINNDTNPNLLETVLKVLQNV
ncbi:IS66 family insertion sequence element accessory protein TnpA [Ruminiclostridium josui]|uniref:IS66 family insertion sequence element accessory protein TnpA n=1 Tax=Ruminiclostridium josui TaxID=1499 RepID=UPI0004670336|nr:hypothetical protein [Ruminiclostridium josui]